MHLVIIGVVAAIVIIFAIGKFYEDKDRDNG